MTPADLPTDAIGASHYLALARLLRQATPAAASPAAHKADAQTQTGDRDGSKRRQDAMAGGLRIEGWFDAALPGTPPLAAQVGSGVAGGPVARDAKQHQIRAIVSVFLPDAPRLDTPARAPTADATSGTHTLSPTPHTTDDAQPALAPISCAPAQHSSEALAAASSSVDAHQSTRWSSLATILPVQHAQRSHA